MLIELPGSTNELPVGRVAAQFPEVSRGGKFGFEQRSRKREKKKKKKERPEGEGKKEPT